MDRSNFATEVRSLLIPVAFPVAYLIMFDNVYKLDMAQWFSIAILSLFCLLSVHFAFIVK